MNKPTIQKNATRLIVLLLLWISQLTIANAQSTITSSVAGGNWTNAATWIGNVVPAAGDNVIINSNVYVNSDVQCNSLTVNSGDTLCNLYGYSITVTVVGSLVNNGIILNNPSGYSLYLSISGDIENNGTWNVSKTTLAGNTIQTMKETAGKLFEGPFFVSDSIGDVLLASDVMMSGSNWNLNRTTIQTNGHQLITDSYTLRNGYISSNDKMDFDETTIQYLTINGAFTLDGKIYSQGGNVFKGTVTVADTIVNLYGWTNTINVEGKIINNGAVINNPSGYSLYVDVNGDIVNNGTWSLATTSISGTADHFIEQTQGTQFEGPFSMTDSVGNVVLKSDVLFTGSTFNLNKTVLRTNGHVFRTKNQTLTNGYIASEDTLMLDNSIIESLNFSGNYKLSGNIYSQGNIICNDTLTITDTLFNRYGWTNTIRVKGNIINKGTFKNNPDGYSLSVNIDGNVRNEGIWNLSSTNFTGTTNQIIEQAAGKPFEGTINTTDSNGDIVMASDILIQNNTWNLNDATIKTNGHNLLSKSSTFNGGKIVSNDTLKLDNSTINNMSFFGKYALGGNIYSQGGIVFNDNATVVDTLFNLYGWTNTISVKGNIVNKGTIKNNPSGYSLSMDIDGNIRNEGIWNLSSTNFTGTTDQFIEQAAGTAFEGAINTTDSVGEIKLTSDILIQNNTWKLNTSILKTNGHNLFSKNSTFNGGYITSNDTLVLDNSTINNMGFYGNYTLGGNIYSQGGIVFNDNCTVVDTLFNLYGWTNTISVKGNIVNKGTIKNNPSGYSLSMDVDGNIRNEGIWNLAQTAFTGAANQTIEQTTGKRFEGAFNTTDAKGDVVLASDIMLESNTWKLNTSTIKTNGFKLNSNNYTLTNGIIQSNDTVTLNNSVIESMQFFGNYKLNGNVVSQGNNVFNDTLTVLDTLMNRYGWTNTALVNGDLINKGTITNNPSGYSFNLDVKGNISNFHLFSIANLYLSGTNKRTITGSNTDGIQAAIVVTDSICIIGTSSLSSIAFQSGNAKAWCVVDTGASLTVHAISGADRIINYGKLTVSQLVDNSVQNTLSFYQASVNCKAGVEMTKLTVDHYGYQQHPTATGAVNCWWRLRNFPQNFNDTLSWLKLSYKKEELNGNIEDSIKVFYSANAGLDWKRIKTGVSVDTLNNTVTISKVPSAGHYLLATTTMGITTFHPLIESAEPRFGGNSGQVTMYIYGAGFKPTSHAILRRTGLTDINADTSYVTDAIGESMLARFNLKGKSLGDYDVVVETPGENTLTLPGYFTIIQGDRSEPWVALTGRDRFLVNRWQTFNLNYGNTANVDARGVILVFVVNDLPNLDIQFPDIKVTLPKALINDGEKFTRIADSVPLFYTTDTLSGYVGTKMRVYPFYIPVLSAGSSKSMRVKVKLDGFGTLTMDSWVVDPFYEGIPSLKSTEPMPSEVRACITAAAMKYMATGVIGLIPGMGCYNLVDKVVDPIGYITPESIKPEEAESSIGSWLWSGVSWASSITQCATSFVPGLGQATQIGIGIASMIIDSKDNYDTQEGCWRKFRKKSDSKKNSKGVTSFDPNEIVGPQGYTSEHYISKEGNINYRIYFENKKTAAASALEVFVKDTIDLNQFDYKTFSFNSISFSDTTIRIQDYAKEFTVLVDMHPKKNILVQVHGLLDTVSGVVSWDFRTLDRITKELVEDPDSGFLPPNVLSPEGEGNVAFSCKLKKTVTHDDVISNKATIVFDLNAPIVTNTFTNRIDTISPNSEVLALSATQDQLSFDVSWSGNDEGCGMKNYNIFVAEGKNPYVLWKVASGASSANFAGEDGKTYSFYSIAADSLGLTEGAKTSPEASTKIQVVGAKIVGNVKSMVLCPNVAKKNTDLSFELKDAELVTITVENTNGETVQTIMSQKLMSGKNHINVDLSLYPSGMYFVRIKGTKNTEVRNLFVVK